MHIGDIATRELYTPHNTAPGSQNYPASDNSPNIENENNVNSRNALNNDSTTTSSKANKSLLLKLSVFIGLVVLVIASFVYFNRDHSDPGVVVRTYYQAYFKGDYETMAQNLSVFWGVQFMPQYMTMSPQELIENRPAIEKNMAEFISGMELGNKVQDNMSINMLPEYTQRTDNTALVVYEFRQQNKAVGMEMALLLKENNHMRILKMITVDQEQLDHLTGNDIAEIEESFKEMLER